MGWVKSLSGEFLNIAPLNFEFVSDFGIRNVDQALGPQDGLLLTWRWLPQKLPL
jgi:hypothetical protein